MRERWDDVRVKVIRPGPVDQRGVCANSIPQEDLKATSLPQGKVSSSRVWDLLLSGVVGEGGGPLAGYLPGLLQIASLVTW